MKNSLEKYAHLFNFWKFELGFFFSNIISSFCFWEQSRTNYFILILKLKLTITSEKLLQIFRVHGKVRKITNVMNINWLNLFFSLSFSLKTFITFSNARKKNWVQICEYFHFSFNYHIWSGFSIILDSSWYKKEMKKNLMRKRGKAGLAQVFFCLYAMKFIFLIFFCFVFIIHCVCVCVPRKMWKLTFLCNLKMRRSFCFNFKMQAINYGQLFVVERAFRKTKKT